MFLFFEDFQPQNILIFLLFSMKDFQSNWFIGDIEYFNTILEEYKVIYPDETFSHITKYDFYGVQVFLL